MGASEGAPIACGEKEIEGQGEYMGSRIKTISPRLALGIFMLYLPLYGNGAMSPAVAAFDEAFPGADITLVSLIAIMPSLTTIFGCLLVPLLVRRRPIYRQVGIVSLAVYAVFGVIPFFVHDSIEIILVFRAICGFGVGLLFPLGAAVIMRLIGDRDERSRQLGRGQSISQVGGIALTLLGGFLCTISWEYTFLAYALVVVSLVGFIVLYRDPIFPEPGQIDSNDSVDGVASTPGKNGLPAFAWLFVAILTLMQVCYNSVIVLTSPLLVEISGSSDVAGLAAVLLSMLTVAGAIGALCMGALLKKLGRFAGPLTMVVMGAIGVGCIALGGSVAFIAVGFFISGFCFSVIVPLTVIEIGNWATAAALTLASTVSMIATNAGNFFSAYLIGFLSPLGDSVAFSVQVCAVLITVLGALWGVVNMFNRAYRVS